MHYDREQLFTQNSVPVHHCCFLDTFNVFPKLRPSRPHREPSAAILMGGFAEGSLISFYLLLEFSHGQ